MTAHVARPSIALAPHAVPTEDIEQDMRARGVPSAHIRLMRSTTVQTRYFTKPLISPTVSGDAAFCERNATAFQDALVLATDAGRQALSHAGLAASQVDALITSHTTSWTVPSLDVALVKELGLRPDVRRIPLTSAGCAGGASALNHAVDQLASKGSHVLIVVAECLSAATYNPAHAQREEIIYRGLFGDSASAVVVSAAPTWTGPAIALGSPHESFTYLLPDSTVRYRGQLTEDGLAFLSDRTATQALGDCMPAIQFWLDEGSLEWAAVHPGGPRILQDAAIGLGLDPDPQSGSLRRSWACLRDHGNLGGSAVLDVIAAYFSDPPADGSPGLIIGFGPGFAVEAVRCTWESTAGGTEMSINAPAA